MEGTFITLVFSICFVQNSLGLPTLNCDNADPILPSTVKCSCQNVGAPGIKWYREGVVLTSCTLSGGQCFTSMGYTFTVDSTTSTYTIEFGSYNYTECTLINCSDSTAPSKNDSQRISVDVTNYSSTLSVVNEPASSHMNGNIDFTTGCIYKANSSDINVTTAKWTAVVNGTEEGDLDIKGTISKTGSCQFCTDDFASTILVRYIHQEEQSESRIKANIRLRILIDGVPYNKTTRNEYFVKVRSSPTENPCYCWCWFDKIEWCICIGILFSVAGLMLLSYIPAAVIGFNQQLSGDIHKVLNYKNCRLFIPFFGLYLIIMYYRLNKVKPETPKYPTNDKGIRRPASSGAEDIKLAFAKSSPDITLVKLETPKYPTNKGILNMLWRPASNGAEDRHIKLAFAKSSPDITLDGMLTTCRRKHQRIAGEDEICCDNCKETRKSNASHAYCLSDKKYICTSCLNKCHKQCVLLWNTGNIASKDHNLCCIEHYKMEDLKLEGVCQECKRFICSKCMKKHETHVCTRHQQLHESFSGGAGITPNQQDLSSETKTCSGCRSQPIECLNVHSNIIVCADCFEKGKQPAKGRLNVNDIKDILPEGQKPCQIHGVLGKGQSLPVEAFCFVCKLYMCVECFKKHRRIYDYWSKNLEGNMFYCSYCKGDEMLPVVCFDLLSRGFKCAKCFQFKRQTSETKSLPAEVSKTIYEITGSADPFLCHKDLSKDGRMSCTADVYCLVCKVIMCRNCFNRHQQENEMP